MNECGQINVVDSLLDNDCRNPASVLFAVVPPQFVSPQRKKCVSPLLVESCEVRAFAWQNQQGVSIDRVPVSNVGEAEWGERITHDS